MKLVAGVALLAAALCGAGWALTAEGLFAVLFGWITFLRGVVPQVTVGREGMIVGVAALALFVAGMHWLGRGIWQARGTRPGSSPSAWRFRWTAAIVLVVLIAFSAGISVVGIVHQVGWLVKSRQPFFGEALSGYSDQSSLQAAKMVGFAVVLTEAARSSYPVSELRSEGGMPLHGWEIQCLPIAGFYSTKMIDRSKPWNDPANKKYFQTVIPEFINPQFRTPPLRDEHGYGLNHYAGNRRVMTPDASLKRDELPDGGSHTILLGEVASDFSPWGRPGNVRDPAEGLNRDATTFGGPRADGSTIFAMADGSTRVLNENVDPTVLRALSTPDVTDE